MMEQEQAILNEWVEDLAQSNNFVSMRQSLQHGQTDCLLHSISVAYFSYAIAVIFNLKLDKRSLVRGALLHDFFLYDWHEPDRAHRFHGFSHPKTALKNALGEWELNDREKDIIAKHMFPLVPEFPCCKESLLVCMLDKTCSLAEILRLPPHKKVKALYDCALKTDQLKKEFPNGKKD
jgi:uncharacterized protein